MQFLFQPGGEVFHRYHSFSIYSGFHEKPTTFIFRGYNFITHIFLGPKTFIFHGFGVQWLEYTRGGSKRLQGLCALFAVVSLFVIRNADCQIGIFRIDIILICKRSDGPETSTISLNWQGNDCMYCM